MDSSSQNHDNALLTDDDVSVAIDNLPLVTVSSYDSTLPPKNNETDVVQQNFPPQSDINSNEIGTNNSSLITTSDGTAIQSDVPSDNHQECSLSVPGNFIFTKDSGLTCVTSRSVVPMDMVTSQADSIRDKIKLDYVIRQNDHSNSQQNSFNRSPMDCIITLYDSENEFSDYSLDDEDDDDDSTDQHSELEYFTSYADTEKLSSSDESLRSDGESVDSSSDGPSDSDENSSDDDDEPCDSDLKPSDDEPCDSDEDCGTTSEDEKPEPSDDEDEDGSSSVTGEDSSDHEDEEESSDDDRSIDLGESSESSSESSDNSNE